MAPKFKDSDVVLAFSGSVVSYVHTVVAYGRHGVFELPELLLTL